MARAARTKTGIYRGGRDDAPISSKARVVSVHDASHPIARAIAIHLADRGQAVLACGSDPMALLDLPRETAMGGLIEVTSALPGQRRERALDLFGRLDATVAVAEVDVTELWGPFEQMNPGHALASGLVAPTIFAHEMAQALVAAGARPEDRHGRLVLVNAMPGLPFGAATAAARAGLEGLFEALRIELAILGLEVVMVSPELVVAPPPAPLPAETLDLALQKLPEGGPRRVLGPPLKALLSRAVSHHEVAEAVMRALTDPKPKPRMVPRSGGRLLGVRANRALARTAQRKRP